MNPEEHPRDVIGPHALTLETLRALDSMAGSEVTVTEPGEVITDVDGIPIAVGPNLAVPATFTGAVFTRAELDRLGGKPEDFPNITFIDTGA